MTTVSYTHLDVYKRQALLLAGADKVAVNSAAVARPELVADIADRFGSQCAVGSIDARRVAAVSYTHLDVYKRQNHHIAESMYKALARALRAAVEIDPRKGDAIPSTKGVL